jgi:hypothetical protein
MLSYHGDVNGRDLEPHLRRWLRVEGGFGRGGAMSKVEEYRKALRELDHWDAFLLAESGLPGPRGNIELARAVAEEGDEELFGRYLAYDEQRAPASSPGEFLAFCGILGLGRLLAQGRMDLLPTLRECASDGRWRSREAVVMALQRLGLTNMDLLLQEMAEWSQGSLLEKRAAVAALCEPALLGDPRHAREVLRLLDGLMASIEEYQDRKADEFQAFRKGMGYCWSVGVAALPEEGKKVLEKWFASDDGDVRWIMKQNLRKKRLERMDAEWVRTSRTRFGMR